MATLLIRDVPDEVHRELIAQAEQARRSKEKHALFLLETGLRRKMSHPQVMAKAQRIRNQIKGEISIGDILKYTEQEH